MPESPKYLVSVGKLKEAKKSFSSIAWYNRKPLIWDESKYSKSGRSRPEPALVCSEDSLTPTFVLELGNLPLYTDESRMRDWLFKIIGEKLFSEVNNVGLYTDMDVS